MKYVLNCFNGWNTQNNWNVIEFRDRTPENQTLNDNDWLLGKWPPAVFSKGGTSFSLRIHKHPGHSTAPERMTVRRSEVPQWFLSSWSYSQSLAISCFSSVRLIDLGNLVTSRLKQKQIEAIEDNRSKKVKRRTRGSQAVPSSLLEIKSRIPWTIGPDARATNLEVVSLESTFPTCCPGDSCRVMSCGAQMTFLLLKVQSKLWRTPLSALTGSLIPQPQLVLCLKEKNKASKGPDLDWSIKPNLD